MEISDEQLERMLDKVLERHLRPIHSALWAIQREEQRMDAAGEALQNEIEQLSDDVKADNAAVVSGGEAVAAAGTKFAELKALLEKQANEALSDEEAQTLTTLSGEVDASLQTANTSLTEHVQTLGADTSAA